MSLRGTRAFVTTDDNVHKESLIRVPPQYAWSRALLKTAIG